MIRRWSTPFLREDADKEEPKPKRALIILNQPFSRELLLRLWSACQWHACADGGANRLYDTVRSAANLDTANFLPDIIKGDLDSAREDVLEYYRKQCVQVVRDDDQNSTDLMKCLRVIEEIEETDLSSDQYTVILLGGLSGRVDQTIHTMSYLHKLRLRRKETFVITDDNIGWVLDGGEHIIEIDSNIIGPTCGLLPVGVSNSVITTKGLKWDVESLSSSFDGLISSSNAADSEEVYVKTSRPIFWNIELAFLKGP